MPESVQTTTTATDTPSQPPKSELIQTVSLEEFSSGDNAPVAKGRRRSRALPLNRQSVQSEDVLQAVALDRFAGLSRKQRSAWWSTPSGTMPTWLLGLSWTFLGVPAMLLSLYTLSKVFLFESELLTTSAQTSEFLFGLIIAIIVNTSSLVLFSILGRQTARKLRLNRRRQRQGR